MFPSCCAAMGFDAVHCIDKRCAPSPENYLSLAISASGAACSLRRAPARNTAEPWTLSMGTFDVNQALLWYGYMRLVFHLTRGNGGEGKHATKATHSMQSKECKLEKEAYRACIPEQMNIVDKAALAVLSKESKITLIVRFCMQPGAGQVFAGQPHQQGRREVAGRTGAQARHRDMRRASEGLRLQDTGHAADARFCAHP